MYILTNIFESLKDFLKPLVDNNNKKPLHTGEVTNHWLLLTLLEEGVSLYEMGMNTTNNNELLDALGDGLALSKKTINNLGAFLKEEGIPLPATSPEKPKSDSHSIPLGVKYSDDELANLISAKVAAQITLIGQSLAMSIRNDSAQLMIGVLIELLKYSTSFKTLMESHGWLKIPPYYYPPGTPN